MSIRITIRINTSNPAFADSANREVASILQGIANQLDDAEDGGGSIWVISSLGEEPLYDTYGHWVGSIEVVH